MKEDYDKISRHIHSQELKGPARRERSDYEELAEEIMHPSQPLPRPKAAMELKWVPSEEQIAVLKTQYGCEIDEKFLQSWLDEQVKIGIEADTFMPDTKFRLVGDSDAQPQDEGSDPAADQAPGAPGYDAGEGRSAHGTEAG